FHGPASRTLKLPWSYIMSSKERDETSGIVVAFSFIAVAYIIMALVAFAIAAFASVILTILCVAAWNRPLVLGSHILEPPQARAFVARGMVGMVTGPALLGFFQLLFGIQVQWEYLPLFLLFG